jgi:hypothetical protein
LSEFQQEWPDLQSNRETIKKLIAARKKTAAPSYKVTLGKSVDTLRSVRVDIAQLSTYIVGMPDTGKSNLLARMFLENQDHSKILIDPQGKLTNEVVLPNIDDPSRVIYFAPWEQQNRPLGFNPFDLGKAPSKNERDALVGSLRSIFAHLWVDSFREYPRMAMVIQNSLRLLVQFEGMTFLDMARLLIDKTYRVRLAQQADDPWLRDFWLKHYSQDMSDPTYNKINDFVTISVVRRSVCQPRSSFYLNEAMAQGKTIIVNLGGLQDNATDVLGALFVSRVLSEFIRREPIPISQLTPFAVFVDEFDRYGKGRAFETIISKCRQNMASVCVAHQHWGQLSQSMEQTVTQAAYVVCFQVNPRTAQGIQGVFGPQANLLKVPVHHAWARTTKKKTGSVPEVNLIRTRKAPKGDPAKAEEVKRLMWPLGRPVDEIDADINASYDVICRYNVTKDAFDGTQEVQPERGEELPRAQADWPAGFRNRPSAVFDRVGE